MKRYGKILASFFAAAAIAAALLAPAVAEAIAPAVAVEGAYLKIGDKTYTTEDEIKGVTKPDSTVVTKGCTIEVYGKVKLPLVKGEGKHPSYPNFTWVLSQDNVIVEGKTDDAAVYCDVDVKGGAGGLQSTVHVLGNGVTFKNLAILPNYNTAYAGSGNVNKTVEVWGSAFTMDGCTIEANDIGDGKKTGNGGALFFTGPQKQNITVKNSTFKNCYTVFCDTMPTINIMISGNTFDTPQDDTYLIGNNTWATPPGEKMGSVYVENNTFKNLPEDYKKIVYHRMTGTFYLKGNKIENSKGSAKVLDRVSFGRLEGTHEPSGGKDCASDGKAVIMLTEGGADYKITAKIEGGKYVNVVTKYEPETKPVAPVITDKPENVELLRPEVIAIDPKTATETEKTEKKAEAAKNLNVEGITASDIAFDKEGNAVLASSVIASASTSAIKLVKLPEGTYIKSEDIAALPIMEAAVQKVNNVAAVAFEVTGAALKAKVAKDVMILKTLSATSGEFFTFAAAPADFTDKHFAIETVDASGKEAILAADAAIAADGKYKLILFVQDNGDFDLCKDKAGKVVDPAAIVAAATPSSPAPSDPPTPTSHSSSSGCNATGWGLLALLAAVPAIKRKK